MNFFILELGWVYLPGLGCSLIPLGKIPGSQVLHLTGNCKGRWPLVIRHRTPPVQEQGSGHKGPPLDLSYTHHSSWAHWPSFPLTHPQAPASASHLLLPASPGSKSCLSAPTETVPFSNLPLVSLLSSTLVYIEQPDITSPAPCSTSIPK